MSGVPGINRQLNIPTTINAAGQARDAAAPQATAGHASAGRIAAAVFTLGISEGIRAIIHAVRAGNAPAPRLQGAGLPHAAPRADHVNAELANKIGGQLPPAFEAALREGFDELRADFGEAAVPRFGSPAEFSGNARLRMFNLFLGNKVRGAGDEVTPQALKSLVVSLRPQAADCAMQEEISACCRDHHFEDMSIVGMKSILFDKYPERTAALAACRNAADVHALFASIPEAADVLATSNEENVAERQAHARVFNELSQRAHIPESVLKTSLGMREFENKCNYLASDINSGVIPRSEMAERFTALTDRFIQEKMDMLGLVDQLNAPGTLKTGWKDQVLRDSGMQHAAELRHIANAGTGVDGSGLLAYLRTDHPRPQEAFGLLASFGLRVQENLYREFPQPAWNQLGGDGQTRARSMAMELALCGTPGLMEALGTLPAAFRTELGKMGGAMFADGSDMQESATTAAALEEGKVLGNGGMLSQLAMLSVEQYARSPADVAGSLVTADIPVPYAVAIHDAIGELRGQYGADLPQGDSLMGWKAAGGDAARFVSHVQDAVGKLGHQPTPAELFTLVGDTVRSDLAGQFFRAGLTAAMGERGIRTEDRMWQIMHSLHARHPDLQARFAGAAGRQAVADILHGITDAEDVCRREQAIGDAQARIRDQVADRLRDALQLSQEQAGQLDLRAFASGPVLYLAQDLARESDANPSVPMDTASVDARFKAIGDRFIAGKSALFTSVSELSLSPELRADWQHEVLANVSLKDGGFLRSCSEVADRMDGSGLLAALRAPETSVEEQGGLLKTLGSQIDTYSHVAFKDTIDDMGSDEFSMINRFSREAFLDRNPELVAELSANPARREALNASFEAELSNLTSRMGHTAYESQEMRNLQAQFASASTAMQILSTVEEMLHR